MQYFEADDLKPGQHLDLSSTEPGSLRATIRDGSNNLVGQLNLRQTNPEGSSDPVNLRPTNPDDSSDPEVDPDLALLGGLALVGLTVAGITAVSSAVSSARGKKERRRELEWRIAEARRDGVQVAVASRRVAAPAGWYDDGSGQLRWWDGQAWTEQYCTAAPRVSAPAGWYDDGSGQLRWWDGQDWTQHYFTAGPQVAAPAGWYDDSSGRQRWWDGQEWTDHYQGVHPHHGQPALVLASSSELERGYDLPAISLSRAQWEEQVRVMLQARTISELQWRLLSSARIEGADSDLLQWQDRLKTLTAEDFSRNVDRFVASQPAHALELATAGWYDDGLGRQRWWDGLEWTEYVQPDESRMLLPGR
jgi:hypothetical protein